MNRVLILTAIIFLSVVMISCGGDDDNSKPEGSSGGNCFSNGTCNIGLECHLTTNVCYEKLAWSEISSDPMTWDEAVSYCEDLDTVMEDGYLNWRLPTISELRTLVENCLNTEIGGECGITDSCLSEDCYSDSCHGCPFGDTGYSVYEDIESLWSSSVPPDGARFAYIVDFEDGSIGGLAKVGTYYVRCVK